MATSILKGTSLYKKLATLNGGKLYQGTGSTQLACVNIGKIYKKKEIPMKKITCLTIVLLLTIGLFAQEVKVDPKFIGEWKNAADDSYKKPILTITKNNKVFIDGGTIESLEEFVYEQLKFEWGNYAPFELGLSKNGISAHRSDSMRFWAYEINVVFHLLSDNKLLLIIYTYHREVDTEDRKEMIFILTK